MRPALILCLAAILAAADGVATVRLANDQVYADKLQAVLAQRPDGRDREQLFHWIWTYCNAAMDDRDYVTAETAARALVAMAPQYNIAHSNLSVALGKQGRYQEALQEAEVAKLLDPSDSMHADAVACSWMYYLGRKEAAIARFKAIAKPLDPQALGLYWGCQACFYATVGSVEEIRTGIANALQADPEHRGFFERDVVFDQYRAEPWFIALVGRTLP